MDRRGLSLISIDRWGGGSQAYFLTHLHSDHTQGLCSTWRWGPLFCSRLSAKLFPLKFPGLDLSLLRVLDLGLWYSVSLVSPSSGAPTVLEVMAIDAHHCPGAVMFLFRGEFGCMLYTGDFRWEIGSKRSQRARDVLSDALRSDTMNALYLDNTYCNPSYTFPSRHVAALQIVDIIVSHPKHDIVIGIDSLGKEELLAHISRVLKIKIWVWPERLQIMHLLGYRDIFTTKTSLTRVRAVPRYSFSIETLEGLNTMRPTIGIMPSGLPWLVRPRGEESAASLPSLCRNERPKTKTRPVERIHEHIYSVPYSDHSCFCEIEDFVKLLQPIKIKGIVASSACYVNPLYYFGCGLSGENKPLRGFSQKFETKDEDGVKSKSRVAKRERESISVIRGLGGRVNRVQILRRLTRGAKIVELD